MNKTLTARSYSQSSYILPTPVTLINERQREQDSEEQEYLQWKRANGLEKPLSRAEYENVFNIYN